MRKNCSCLSGGGDAFSSCVPLSGEKSQRNGQMKKNWICLSDVCDVCSSSSQTC